MARCKYCHEQISRIDKEVCPYCGGRKPLEGTDTSTQDVTKVVNQVGSGIVLKQKKKLFAALLAFFLGFVGAHNIYLGKYKQSLASIISSLVIIGGIGTIFFFFVLKGSFLAYFLPGLLVELFYIVIGIRFFTKSEITDANGDFLV